MADAQERIEQLAVECLERLRAEGQACVGHVCKDAPELAAPVRELLARLQRVGLLVEAEASAPTSRAATGDRIGVYRLLRRLGSGGMGEVFLADDERLGRQVALKRMHALQAGSATARERFRREIAMVGKLDHSGICAVFDAGECDGVPFLVMRHLPGETLAARIERARGSRGSSGVAATATDGRSAIDEVLQLGEKLGRALHFAHEHGLVHRDVKPGNVIVTPEGEPVLLDFGLARACAEELSLTLTSDRLGTPAYMAPEQVRGDEQDRRTDVYGLGATLYEALTLGPPHPASSREQVFQQIVSDDVTPASRRNRRIPRDLEVVLSKALDREPSRRYATAAAFADDLARLRQRQPVLARRLPAALRALRWTQRHPVVATALALLAVGLAISLALIVSLQRSLQRARALQLASASLAESQHDTTLALKLALCAVQRERTPETLSQLFRAYGDAHEAFDPEVSIGSTPRAPGAMPVWFTAAAISPDGAHLAVGGSGIWILRSTTGELVREWPIDWRGKRRVIGLAFTPTGDILCAGADGLVRTWTLAGEPVGAAMAHEHAVLAALALPDGDIVTMEGPGRGHLPEQVSHRVWRWRGGTRSELFTIDTMPFCMDADAENVVVGGSDGNLHWWSPAGVRVVRLPSWVVGARLLPGARVLVCTVEGTATVFGADGREERRLVDTAGALDCVAATPDGGRLACAGKGVLHVFDRGGDLLLRFPCAPDLIDLDFDPTGTRLVAVTQKGDGHVYDVQVPDALVMQHPRSRVCDVAIDPDSKRFATAGSDGTARIWNADDGAPLHVLPHEQWVTALAFCPDGRLVTGEEGRSDLRAPQTHLHVFDSQGRSRLVIPPPGTGESVGSWIMRSVRVSPDGQLLLACSSEEVSWWTAAGQFRGALRSEELRAAIGHGPTAAEFAPDGNHVVIGSWNNGAAVFAIEPGEAKPSLPLGVDEPTLHAVFSPDGRMVATAHQSGLVQLWSLDQPKRPLRVFSGHHQKAWRLCFSPDGGRLLSASVDGRARMWDVATGEWLWSYDCRDAAVWGIAWSPDGRHALTGDDDGTARSWLTDAEELIRRARARACRAFRPKERERYRDLLDAHDW